MLHFYFQDFIKSRGRFEHRLVSNRVDRLSLSMVHMIYMQSLPSVMKFKSPLDSLFLPLRIQKHKSIKGPLLILTSKWCSELYHKERIDIFKT